MGRRKFFPESFWSDDGFLDGRLHLLQSRDGYRAGLESVMLAAAVPAEPGDRILEPGLGAGVAALCVAFRVEGTHITGIEIEPTMASLSLENALRNDCADRLHVVIADVTMPMVCSNEIASDSFDHAFANPPFYLENCSRVPENAEKRSAHTRQEGALDLWIRFMIRKVKNGGSLSFILPTDSLKEVLFSFDGCAGDTLVFPLFPRIGEPARRILVRSYKGKKGPLKLLPGMVLHDLNGRVSPEADEILRKGKALALHTV
ncbi:MAG: methyltransferase [Alphaproteobacteria bacterium]|nr:methyltransferase [Alphaproteobacteria bacterium]